MTDPIDEFIRRSREIEGRAQPGRWHAIFNERILSPQIVTDSPKTPSDNPVTMTSGNLELITHARNTHRALLDALEVAVSQIDDDLNHFHGTYCGAEEFAEASCCNGCLSLRDSKKKIESLLAEAMKET